MPLDTYVQFSTSWSVLFCVALCASVLLKLWLAGRQIRHVSHHRGNVPTLFADKVTSETHQRAADYTIAQSRLGILELVWSAVITIGWTLLGGLHQLNAMLYEWLGSGMTQQLALLAVFTLIGTTIDLPFSIYRTFVLEQRFGFNKVTSVLWVIDLLKAALLGVIIGLPLAALVLWMMGATGNFWWLWTWGVWTAFNLLMLVIYPTWIAPLFNQFKPLEDPELKQRVTALMNRCGFSSKGLFVMDGSKRSAHANAYFTGLGQSKRVVFYDTLLNQLTAPEVDAVLAHELGHFKHRHIWKRMISMFALSLAGFWLMGWLGQQVWFFLGLGVQPDLIGPNNAILLLLFSLSLPAFTSFIGPLFAQISRKHEFEADAYAVSKTNGADLASALLKLYKDNASTLTPDPLYVKFYYSHPPASERLGRLQLAR